MKVHVVDSFVLYKYMIVHCCINYFMYTMWSKVCFFFSQSFLITNESIFGKIWKITPHQRKILFFFIKKKICIYASVKNTYKWWSIFPTRLTTIICIHVYQIYMTELPILLSPVLPFSRISDNSKFCNGPVNFEITRFNYIYIYIYNTCSDLQNLTHFIYSI